MGRRAGLIYAGMAVAVIFILVLVACGGPVSEVDPYSGAWAMYFDNAPTPMPTSVQLKIAKSGSAWTVTDTLGQDFTFVQKDGSLVGTTGAPMTLKREGDKLAWIEGGQQVMRLFRLDKVPSPWPSE